MPTSSLDPRLLGELVLVEHIPVIDVGPLLHGSPAERRMVLSIGAACRDIGFFVIIHHDVPLELVERTFDVCRQFFALPTEEKAQIAIEQSSCHRGWFSVGGENLDPRKQVDAGDLKEGIKVGQDLPLTHRYVQSGVALHGPNQWPADPPDFTPTLREYFGALTMLARRVVGAFALALDLDECYFDRFFAVPMATAGPLRYPPHVGEITEQRLGAGAHSDYGAVTMLAQDAVGGLQVRDVEGRWLSVPPVPKAFVVNVGDMTARWTNEVFTSTVHRVVNVSGVERFSIPFFFDPTYDADVTAIPTCVPASGSPKYEPTSLQHLLERIDASFSYRAQSPIQDGRKDA